MKDTPTDYYKIIYENYASQLIHFAEKFVTDFFAEDIVHDVFIKLWEKQIYLLPEEEQRKILYASVRNACIDYLRREELKNESIDNRQTLLKLDELYYFRASDEMFMQKDLLEFLMKKVSELPLREQQIFRMSYMEGLRSKEIAAQLDISIRTVDNQLYRALMYLRKECSQLLLIPFL